MMRRILLALSATVLVLAFGLTQAAPVLAGTVPRRIAAMRWAIRQAGSWYCYGGTSGCFDCSGLVYSAYKHAGVWLPRTTYGMIGSSKLVRIPVRDARRGNLLFYGSGHVELKTKYWHTSFGAHHSGTRVGWYHWNSYYHPTMAFRLRW